MEHGIAHELACGIGDTGGGYRGGMLLPGLYSYSERGQWRGDACDDPKYKFAVALVLVTLTLLDCASLIPRPHSQTPAQHERKSGAWYARSCE